MPGRTSDKQKIIPSRPINEEVEGFFSVIDEFIVIYLCVINSSLLN